MTVTAVGFSGPTWVQSPANGAATTFNFPFLITASSDLVVGFIVSGVYTLQLGGYSVSASSIGNSGGGQVIFSTAPIFGTTVDIRSYISETQPTNFSNLGAYYPESTTNSVDRVTRLVTDLYRMTYLFGIHGPDQENIPWTSLPSAAARANALLAFDANGLPTIGVQNSGTLLTQAQFNAFLSSSVWFALTFAEQSAGVFPTSFSYPPGHFLRYGADPTGAQDSTSAINNALLCSSVAYDTVGGTYTCSGPLNMRSGQTLHGVGAGTVLQFSSSVDNVYFSSVSGSTLRDFKILVTSTTPAEVGGVHLLNSSYNTIERVQMSGCTWSGVWLDAASNYNVVRDCDFEGFSEPAGSGGDIMIYSIHGGGTTAPSYNHFEGNRCNGGGGYGIAVQDPYAATGTGFPTRNTAIGNKVGAHITYGMMIYMPGNGAAAQDTYNAFIGNKVENIQGSTPTNTSAGAGIYLVGNGIGGSQVIGNSVINCCISTSARSLAPAGISVAGCQTGITPPLIADNSVAFMSQGDGILVTSSPGGATVTGNSVNMPSTNTGAGAGGASLAGAGLRIEASSQVVLGPNQVWVYGSGSALFVYANGINTANVVINGGLYVTGPLSLSPALFTQQQGGFNVTQMQLSGARFIAENAANDAVSLNSIIAATLGNCAGQAVGGRGLYVNTSTGVRVNGGQYTTTGSIAVASSGGCTSGYLDESVNFGGNASLVNNAGTGFTVKTRLSAVPSSGTWAVGDTVYNSAPAASGVFVWICTTAPGTFKTVSNT